MLPVALFFVAAGVLHFTQATAYERIVPPYLPHPRLLVWVSGVAEIAGAFGVLVPRLRRLAGWGLVVLLVAVFPANLYMAMNPEAFADLNVESVWLWLRLPLQVLLIGWVWWATIRRRRPSDPTLRGPAIELL